jgi:hypothetical protein
MNWLQKIRKSKVQIDHFEAISENVIQELIPDELKDSWNKFIRGQTGPVMDDGSFGVYIWDWDRFAEKFERGLPLEDTFFEWD